MPLRLVNKDRTYEIEACDTIIHIQSMTIGDKERLIRSVQAISHTGPIDEEKFKRLISIVAVAITKIDGFENETSEETLLKLEDVSQLREIVKAIIDHCDLTPEEAKNSPSSSEQHIPVSAGNAENNA